MRQIALAAAVSCLLAAPLCALAQQPSAVTEWLTTPDRASLLAQQSAPVAFHTAAHSAQATLIAVDDSQTFQTIDGFGGALTDGTTQLLMAMDPAKRHTLLEELFGHGKGAIGISYIRVTIGASDMNQGVYTFDDMPAGQTDPTLAHFSLKADEANTMPVLREILAIAPHIHILATPWSAPAWMKDNGAMKGGSLKPQEYRVFAQYLLKYLEGMKAAGISIDALTLQNEPLNPKNTPSMVVTSDEEDTLLKQDVGPLLRRSGLRTKSLLFDHNCNHPDYPISILADPAAAQYADGSAFHLYEGVISALSTVHDAFPRKNLYFTEQLVTDKPGATDLAIAEPVTRVVIGATRNWSRNVILWNLAADPGFGPHTPDGGCPVCEGAITLNHDTVTRNLSYYTIAQASKFVPAGSVRIASNPSDPAALADVAFRTPDGGYALIVANNSEQPQGFAIVFHAQEAEETLPAGAAATFTWSASPRHQAGNSTSQQ